MRMGSFSSWIAKRSSSNTTAFKVRLSVRTSEFANSYLLFLSMNPPVPPAELEAVLSKHPLLVDSGVIGYFCPKQQTELPRAYIVPKDTSFLDASTPTSRRLSFQDEIEAWVRGQVVHYKALRGGVFLTASIPRSAAGKILRRELKAMDVGRMNQEADEAKGGKVFAKL